MSYPVVDRNGAPTEERFRLSTKKHFLYTVRLTSFNFNFSSSSLQASNIVSLILHSLPLPTSLILMALLQHVVGALVTPTQCPSRNSSSLKTLPNSARRAVGRAQPPLSGCLRLSSTDLTSTGNGLGASLLCTWSRRSIEIWFDDCFGGMEELDL